MKIFATAFNCIGIVSAVSALFVGVYLSAKTSAVEANFAPIIYGVISAVVLAVTFCGIAALMKSVDEIHKKLNQLSDKNH